MESVLLLGNYRPTVAIARRLAGIGYRVIVTRDKGGLAAASNKTAEVWDAPRTMTDPAFFSCLTEFLEQRRDIGIIVPVEEPYVLGLAYHRDELPADRVYGTPADETVITCLDKIAMLKIADEAGIPSAPARVVTSYTEILASANELGFPVVIRPLSSSQPIGGRKALIAMRAGELKSRLTSWPEGHDSLIVQRFIRGPRFNVDFAAQKGRVIQAVATQILRTDAEDGTGVDVCGRTVPMPDDLRKYTARMAAHLNYTGVGLIQFMVDRDRDEISFIELNPRFNGNTAVPDRAGLELCRLSIDLARDPDRHETFVEVQGGLRHAWFFGDVRGVHKSMQRSMLRPVQVPGALFRAIRDAVTADFHVIWSWRDPLPAITQFTNTLRNAVSRDAN